MKIDGTNRKPAHRPVPIPPPNGLRLSGERSRAKRVRCSRGLGGATLPATEVPYLSEVVRCEEAGEKTCEPKTPEDDGEHVALRRNPRRNPTSMERLGSL